VTDFDSKTEFLAKLAQALGHGGIASKLHCRRVLELDCYLFSIDRYEERFGGWRGRSGEDKCWYQYGRSVSDDDITTHAPFGLWARN
jgi:hypothetical protein